MSQSKCKSHEVCTLRQPRESDNDRLLLLDVTHQEQWWRSRRQQQMNKIARLEDWKKDVFFYVRCVSRLTPKFKDIKCTDIDAAWMKWLDPHHLSSPSITDILFPPGLHHKCIHLSIHLYHLSIYLCMCLSLYAPIYSSLDLSSFPSIHPLCGQSADIQARVFSEDWTLKLNLSWSRAPW